MSKSIAICLFRNDLRIHDNPILHHAQKSIANYILPVYIFDPQFFDISRIPGLSEKHEPPTTWFYKLPRNSNNRVKFVMEAVSDLQASLKRRGSDLCVQFGKPDVVLGRIVDRLVQDGYQIQGLYYSREVLLLPF